MNNRCITCHTLIGCRTYNRLFFLTPPSDETLHIQKLAHMRVPTVSRFRITLRRRQPHEPSSKPSCRPSRGAVEAGGHGGRRSKRKGPPRVEKRAAKRRERSFFHSFNDTILDFMYIFVLQAAAEIHGGYVRTTTCGYTRTSYSSVQYLSLIHI